MPAIIAPDLLYGKAFPKGIITTRGMEETRQGRRIRSTAAPLSSTAGGWTMNCKT
jgi:hypothetical protein